MKCYQFDLILKDVSDISDEMADRLFACGCDDATPMSRNGVAWLHFDREEASLEAAIRSAVMNVRASGLDVLKVEIEAEADCLTTR